MFAGIQDLEVNPRMLFRRSQVQHDLDFGVGEQLRVGPVRIRVVGAEGLFVVPELLEFVALRGGAAGTMSDPATISMLRKREAAFR